MNTIEVDDANKRVILSGLCDRRRKLRKLVEKFGDETDPDVLVRIEKLSDLIKKIDKA